MKASAALIDRIAEAIAPLDTQETRDDYRRGDFPRAAKFKNLDKRYRWDLFWATSHNLYGYCRDENLNDTHIDTVLKHCVSPL